VPQRQLTWVSRKGEELQRVVYADTMALGPALSHDGRRIAVFRLTDSNADIWAYAVERRTWDRLTVHAGDDIYPLWSRDDSEIIFGSRRGSMDLYRKRLDSPPGGEQLLLSTPQPKFATDWSRDGRLLLYNTVGPKGNVDIWALPLDGTRTPIEILGTAFNEQHGGVHEGGQPGPMESEGHRAVLHRRGRHAHDGVDSRDSNRFAGCVGHPAGLVSNQRWHHRTQHESASVRGVARRRVVRDELGPGVVRGVALVGRPELEAAALEDLTTENLTKRVKFSTPRGAGPKTLL